MTGGSLRYRRIRRLANVAGERNGRVLRDHQVATLQEHIITTVRLRSSVNPQVVGEKLSQIYPVLDPFPEPRIFVGEVMDEQPFAQCKVRWEDFR